MAQDIHISNQQEIVELPSNGEDLRIIINAGITATVIDTSHRAVTYIEVKENASVEYISVFSGEGKVFKEATLQKDASIQWRSAIMSGSTEHEIVTQHVGDGSSSDHKGIFLGKEQDKFAMNYWSNHLGKHTSGHIYVHGVLFDRAYADFKGNIKIAQSGKDTDATLTEDTLLLGERSRSDAIPQLEIDTNDVQVAHSSAITRIDDEKLFYLQSRGIEFEDGKRMIVQGFLEGIIDEFTNETIRKQLYAIIEKRLEYV